MHVSLIRFGVAIGLAWSPIVVPQAIAQEAFPDHTVTIVVPFAAGGGVDTVARIVAEDLRASWSVPVLVENRPGGSGMIAGQALANSDADGHTLMLATAGELAINTSLLKKRLTYDVETDFEPVALAARIPNVFVVGNTSSYKTVSDIVAAAKKAPGTVTYGSSGVGNPQHLTGALLEHAAGISLLHVPYKGASQQVMDTIGGQIDSTFASAVAVLGNVKDGSLRPLAVTSKQRLAVLPDVPTISETAGLENFELINWFGFVAKKGLDAQRKEILHSAIVDALAKPATAAKLAAIGAEYVPMSSSEFAAFVGAETAKFEKIIDEANIKPD